MRGARKDGSAAYSDMAPLFMSCKSINPGCRKTKFSVSLVCMIKKRERSAAFSLIKLPVK
jgi:hypothetical protein